MNIFTCINIRGFVKMGNFACIKLHVLSIIGSLGFHQSNFRGVHIFADVLGTRITRKYVQREKSTFTVSYIPTHQAMFIGDTLSGNKCSCTWQVILFVIIIISFFHLHHIF